jgi:cytidylate kinase
LKPYWNEWPHTLSAAMRETSMAGIRIALVGKSGAGKSEVSRYLAEMHGFSAIKTGAICRTISMILFGNEEKSSTQRLDDTLTAIDPSIFLRASLRDADLTGDMVVDALRFAEDLRLANLKNSWGLAGVAQAAELA